MPISYTRVTWYSQLVAIILFVAVFFFGVYVGTKAVGTPKAIPEPAAPVGDIITAAAYGCSDNRYISALYYQKSIRITLSDGREFSLPQVISASGARYANADESFVFWNKGTSAFTTENGTTTYAGCSSESH